MLKALTPQRERLDFYWWNVWQQAQLLECSCSIFCLQEFQAFVAIWVLRTRLSRVVKRGFVCCASTVTNSSWQKNFHK